MPITVECTACQNPYTVPEQFVGKRVKCKKCGTVFTVKGPGPQAVAEVDPFAEASFEPVREKKTEAPAKWQVPVITQIEAPKPAPVASPSSASSESRVGSIGGASAYIVFLLLAISIAAGVYLTVASFTQLKDSRAANVAVAHIWGWIFGADVLFFAVVAPLLLLGVWGTSQIFNFRMVDSAYWRACSVAAPPTVILYLADAVPCPVAWFLRIAIVPVTLYLLKWLFDLDWLTALIGFIFGAFGWVAGLVITTVILGLILVGNLATISHEIDYQHATAIAQAPAGTPVSPSDSAPGAPAKPLDTPLSQFKDRLQSKLDADWTHSAREEAVPVAQQLRQEAESLRPTYHDDPEWPNILSNLEQFEQKALALPSGEMDPAIFADAADADDWTLSKLSRGLLGEEVSFKQFMLQLPLDAQIKLASSEESPNGLTWNNTETPSISLSVYTRPRSNTKQQRPVVSENDTVLHAAATQGLYSIHRAPTSATFGQISGLPATRVALTDGASEEQQVDYLLPISKAWLIFHLVFPLPNSETGKVMEAAARTVRPMDTGEARADPFAAKYIVGRLATDFDHVAPILRRQGAQAEDALDELLKSDMTPVQLAALQVLHDTATEKSLPILRTLPQEGDSMFAELVRDTIHRIQPSNSNPP